MHWLQLNTYKSHAALQKKQLFGRHCIFMLLSVVPEIFNRMVSFISCMNAAVGNEKER